MQIANFVIDTNNSEEDQLYVEVQGIGTVAIAVNDLVGLQVSVFPYHVVDAPLAEVSVPFASFDEEQ